MFVRDLYGGLAPAGVIRRSTAVLATAGLLAAGLVATEAVIATQPASAEPGNPGVPEDPEVVFEEDFENRPDESVQLLGDYVGADGQTYTADSEWMSLASCNGFVLDVGAPDPGECDSWSGVVSAATAMSEYNGSASSLAAYTAGDPGANNVQLRTAEPIELASDGRFLTFSVDAVAVNCQVSAPLLRFWLEGVDGGETPVSDSPINPCASGGTGTFASDGSFLSDGSSIDIVMRNENGSGAGNDHAIDNIRIVDATPKLDKAFRVADATTGASFPLTFTVTNTSELASKEGWSFTDTLSAGLTVAQDPAVDASCMADVTAEAGAAAIEVTNGSLAAGETSCDITIDVVADATGAFTNGPENITSIVGLEEPGSSTVTVTDGAPIFFGCNEYITFDDQEAAEQWRRRTTTDGFTQHHAADNMNWSAEGGNPGGHVWSEDWEGGSITEMLTPELTANGYASDYGFAMGETLQFDYRNEAGIEFPVYTAIEGANGERYFYTFVDQLEDETGWNRVQVPLDASQWVTGWDGHNGGPDAASPAPTDDQFAAVLADVEHFGFAVESTSRLDELTRFDNFGQPCEDYSDAPESYGGASHRVLDHDLGANTAPLMIGASIDIEAGDQPTAAADGDDASGVADEDGVAGPIEIALGVSTDVAVTAANDTGGDAVLAGWIDLDGSGTFDESELVTVDVPANSGSSEYMLSFGPAATLADTFARFRLFPAGEDVAPTGPARGGEVEDHPVSVAPLAPPAVCTAEERRGTERFWFFGDGGAIDFGVDGTSAETFAGNQYTMEGSTVVTDAGGNLKFWSNGQQVFDRNGDVMPNGDGLLGNPSATQTVAAFAAAGDGDRYFVVTTSTDVDSAANTQLTYSVVDMSLNDGLGAVTDVKNVPLGAEGTASEAITAVPNADGSGYWVLTYTNGSPNVLAYEFDASGPVTGDATVSVMPTVNGDYYGSLAFDAEYSQLVALTGYRGAEAKVRVLGFDAETGAIYQKYEWQLPTGDGTGYTGYNAEFSPDGAFVYATMIFSGGQLYRYQIDGALTGADVKATEEAVGPVGATGGQVRRAPDGKMYVANRNGSSLSVVNTPDAADAGLVTGGFPLADGTTSQFGLPQMVTGCPTPLPQLVVGKTADADGLVEAGDVVEYSVTVSNVGDGDFTVEMPAGVSDDMSDVLDDAAYNGDVVAIASDESEVPEPVVDGNVLTWSGPLAAGETVTITYSVTVTNSGDHDLVNVATAQCGEGIDCGGDVPPVEIPLPHVTPTKSSDPASGETVIAGQEITYSMTFTNDGQAAGPVDSTDDLADVFDDADLTGEPVVDEAHAEQITAVVDGDQLRIEGDLAAGATASVTYRVTVRDDGERGDDVVGNVVTPDQPPFVPAPDCSDDCDPFEPPFTEHPVRALADWKTVDPSSGSTVASGDEVTYTLHFENIGQAPIEVNREDALAGVLDDATVTAQPTSSDDALTVTEIADGRFGIAGTLDPGQHVTVEYTVTVNAPVEQGDGQLVNAIVDPGEEPPAEPGEVCVPAEGERADCTVNRIDNPALEVTKSVTPDEGLAAGDVVEYTVTVSNTGDGDFTAEMPAGVSDDMSDVLDDAAYNGDVVAIASDGSEIPEPVVDGASLTWSGPLAAGERVTITYSVTVTNSGDHDLVNVATPQCDEGIDCDGDVPPVEVLLPHVTPAKSADPASGEGVVAGDVITYTVTFANDGQAAGRVDSIDDLSDVFDDADLTGAPVVDEAHAEQITAVVDRDQLRVEGDLAAGETATVTYQVTVRGDGERGDDVVGNVVIPDRPPYMPAPECEQECEPFEPPFTVHPVGELDDWKTVDPSSGTTVVAGEDLTYTLHFENIGEGPIDVSREDALAGVLDDATVTAQPVTSDDALTVTAIVDGRFGIVGTLEPGQHVTVEYAVTVNEDGARGDDSLLNALVDPGQEPPAPDECAAEGERADCTVNSVVDVPEPEEPAAPAAPEEPEEPAAPLPATGGTIATSVLIGGLALMLMGGVLMAVRRRRQMS